MTALAQIASQWQKVASQQSTTFHDAATQLDALEQSIAVLQAALAADGDDESATATPSVELRQSVANLTKLTTDTKTKLTKDFKSLYTNVTKQSEKMEKAFSTNVDTFCSNRLYGSPAWVREQEKMVLATDKNGGAVGNSVSNALLPYAAITPATTASATSSTSPSAANYSLLSADYQTWIESIMIDSWLRDGRTGLVEALRQESLASNGSKNGAVHTTSSSHSPLPQPTHTDATEFETMHELISALRRRDIMPCMNWLNEEKLRIEQQIIATEAQSAKERVEAAKGSDSTSGGHQPTGRKRVSFSESSDSGVAGASSNRPRSAFHSSMHDSANPSSPNAIPFHSAHLSTLTTHLNSIKELQFDCHRLKFLQLLIDSEHAMMGERKQRKRKHTEDDSKREDEEEEEDATMHDSSDSDEELNRIARAGTTGAAADAPTSSPHHSALKYAQSFFPQFADTRMEDIRKLSGCLLFLGHLTPLSYASDATAAASAVPSHPYSSFFSRQGNRTLWYDVIRRAKSLCLQRMKKPNSNPFLVTLQACDIALPQLIKFQSVLRMNQQIMAASNGAMSSQPEIDLGTSFQYHSTFICPVSKEQCSTTASEEEMDAATAAAAIGAAPPSMPSLLQGGMNPLIGELIAPPAPHSNPPVMLKCGHCISYLAMDKIVRGLRMTRRFKCPTCPREQTPNEVITLHL